MNVWGLNPEELCLEWLMVEVILEGGSFVECLNDRGSGGEKRTTYEMAIAEGRSYDFVLLKQPSLFSE